MPQLAARAKRYVVDHGGHISTCPSAKQLSRECLLWLLDARHIKKSDVESFRSSYDQPSGKSVYVWYRTSRGLSPL